MSDKTATSLSWEKHEKEIQQRQFERMAYHFFEKWQPDDPQKAHEFNGDLFCLVRQIVMDSQQPILDRLTDIARMAPLSFFNDGQPK